MKRRSFVVVVMFLGNQIFQRCWKTPAALPILIHTYFSTSEVCEIPRYVKFLMYFMPYLFTIIHFILFKQVMEGFGLFR